MPYSLARCRTCLVPFIIGGDLLELERSQFPAPCPLPFTPIAHKDTLSVAVINRTHAMVRKPPSHNPQPWAIQRAGAAMVFSPHARTVRPRPAPQALAEELVPRPGGGYQARSAQRNTLSPPTGTFNFVRVQGETPRARPLLISAKLPHAQLTGGRPVVYAGTARFDRGEMAWWSNYSGTYQPIAAFRAQAGLPEDKFVPWQKLQMGGTAMQRGTFTERRSLGAPEQPASPEGGGAVKQADVKAGTASQAGGGKK